MIPTLGKRGFERPDLTSPGRQELITRRWTFLRGIITAGLRMSKNSAQGKIAISDLEGNLSWSDVLPATRASQVAQTANVTDTLIAAAAGEYAASLYVQITTAGAGGTFYASLSYVDDVGGPITVYPTASLPCNATGRAQATYVMRCASGAIDYTFQIVGGAGNPAYTAHLSVVKLR